MNQRKPVLKTDFAFAFRKKRFHKIEKFLQSIIQIPNYLYVFSVPLTLNISNFTKQIPIQAMSLLPVETVLRLPSEIIQCCELIGQERLSTSFLEFQHYMEQIKLFLSLFKRYRRLVIRSPAMHVNARSKPGKTQYVNKQE